MIELPCRRLLKVSVEEVSEYPFAPPTDTVHLRIGASVIVERLPSGPTRERDRVDTARAEPVVLAETCSR